MTTALLMAALGKILSSMTPHIRTLIVEFVNVLWPKVLATPNPIDDWFVKLLAGAAGVTLEEPEVPVK